jgi:transposase
VGIDLGDRVSQFCRLDAAGEIAEQGRLHTTAASMEKHFAKLPATVIALEAGTQSGWIARLLRHFGHQVIVANPRDLAAITSSKKKSDRNDAEKLARLARADLKLLSPTYVRSVESARDAIPLRARDGFVRARTLLVNMARSLAKIEGQRTQAMGPEAGRARRAERQQASDCGGRAKAERNPAQALAHRRGLRAVPGLRPHPRANHAGPPRESETSRNSKL